MTQFIYVFVNFVYYLLSAIQLLMLVRAVMSWLPFDEDNALYNFVFFATEPVIVPVRYLIDKIPATRMLPIDISFLVTVILISIVQVMLPVVYL